MAWNSFFIPVDMIGLELTRWTWFWQKMTVLTRNDLKTHFLPWSTWFDPYWPGGIDFDRKWLFWPETAWKIIFFPGRHGLTRIDPVGSVLTENDGFDPKRPENSFFTLVDMVWPVLTRWDRFWSKMTVLTRNGLKTHFLPWSTWFDSYWPSGLGFDWKWRLAREKYFFEF